MLEKESSVWLLIHMIDSSHTYVKGQADGLFVTYTHTHIHAQQDVSSCTLPRQESRLSGAVISGYR